MGFFKYVGIPVLILIFIMTGVVFGANSIDKYQRKTGCEVFSKESGRETKYVEYTYWYVDCLTPQDGGWISAYNLRGIE